MKTCSYCHVNKEETAFRPGRNQCKQCDNDKQKQYYAKVNTEVQHCECGGTYKDDTKRKHVKTIIHQNFINGIEKKKSKKDLHLSSEERICKKCLQNRPTSDFIGMGAVCQHCRKERFGTCECGMTGSKIRDHPDLHNNFIHNYFIDYGFSFEESQKYGLMVILDKVDYYRFKKLPEEEIKTKIIEFFIKPSH